MIDHVFKSWFALLVVCLPSLAFAQEPVRLAMPIFETEAQVEVRDLERPAAEAAIRDALAEIYRLERLLSPDGAEPGGVAVLHAETGKSIAVDPLLGRLLARELQYCLWSGGAFSPLGGEVERLWRLRDATGEGPNPTDLRAAVESAECKNLEITAGPPIRVKVAPKSVLATSGVSKGFAVDAAVDLLRARGVGNAFVEIGHVVRGIGGGPDGNGWLVAIPGQRMTRNPLDQFWLVNQSLAVVDKSGRRKLDHRKGVPSIGVVQVAAVSELAVDTEVLAHTLFVVGMPDGQRLLGYLNPRPSVFWLLGNGVGAPLESQYRWSHLVHSR